VAGEMIVRFGLAGRRDSDTFTLQNLRVNTAS